MKKKKRKKERKKEKWKDRYETNGDHNIIYEPANNLVEQRAVGAAAHRFTRLLIVAHLDEPWTRRKREQSSTGGPVWSGNPSEERNEERPWNDGNGDSKREREGERMKRKGREGESWTTESTFISPTSWLLMGCSKTVRNNLKLPRLCGQRSEPGRRTEIEIQGERR